MSLGFVCKCRGKVFHTITFTLYIWDEGTLKRKDGLEIKVVKL